MSKDGASLVLEAHGKKVNMAQFNMDNTQLLTAARDSSLKIWDIRTISGGTKEPTVLKTFNKHSCVGYNISAKYFGNEKYILTGSEDNKAYIYEIESGNVVKVLDGHPNVVHLLDSKDDHTIATTCIENVSWVFFFFVQKIFLISQNI